jgi:hypothetical protein
MGQQVFLSYAEEDSQRARQLVEQLRRADYKIWYWQDIGERGGPFIARIEEEINRADGFLAVLSPDFLSSPWCRHERDMALRREVALRKSGKTSPFIIIVQVKPVDYSETGMLGNYDWFDLTQPSREEQEITALLAKLEEIAMTSPNSTPPQSIQTSWPTFVNRENELDELLRNLTNPAGEHFWLVLAGPQMGKSWLLKELPVRLADRANQQWTVRLVDLRDESLDARSRAGKLLSRFFDLEFTGKIDQDTIIEIARKISRRQEPWLCLLDSAEFLSETATEQLRRYLSQVYQKLNNAGDANIRLAFVVASRRPHRKWKGITPTPRFTLLKLTHFKDNVVESALREMARRDGRSFNNSWYKSNAAQLCRITEGLPALLVIYMQWIRDAGYLFGAGQIESQSLFEALAHPYVREVLLSIQGLLSFGGQPDRLEVEREILEIALLKLSAYRLFTQSHLEKIIETNKDLKANLHKMEWTVDHLWAAIGDTYLIEPADEPWRVLYPAIRRLLLRYHYDTEQCQAEAHSLAGKFYQGWWIGVAAGKEQSVVLVERLWHQAEHLRLSSAPETPDLTEELVQFADNLFKGVVPPRGYSLRELLDFIKTQLNEDEELQATIDGIDPELLGMIVSLIK